MANQANEEKTTWGIHAGRTGAAEPLFLNENVIALGWEEFGSFHSLETREEFKERYAEIYPGKSTQSIATSAGQLFRFVHEMKIGDLVVFPARGDRQVHIGEVRGAYEYHPEVNANHPNQREVKWLVHLPRTRFSQAALYEMGSAMSLFQIKNYSDEILAVIEGKAPTEIFIDDTVALVSSDIEEQTRDFVLKQLERNLKGLPLEEFIQHLLETMGYRARVSDPNEPSVDILAHKDELGFEPPIIKVQVKSTSGKIGDRDVSALYGKVDAEEFGLLITLGEFTPPATRFANSKSNLRLIDGAELVDLIFEHYDSFDPKYKGVIPLKRVYVPQVLDGEE
jgi:restriction system protein